VFLFFSFSSTRLRSVSGAHALATQRPEVFPAASGINASQDLLELSRVVDESFLTNLSLPAQHPPPATSVVDCRIHIVRTDASDVRHP